VAGVQLRRYEIEPGHMDDFLEVWRALVAVHHIYGFSIRFGLIDDDASEFVYAVSHDGDFDSAHRQYVESPERAAVRANMGNYVTAAHLSMVRAEREPS
jgi:hypothetical protein